MIASRARRGLVLAATALLLGACSDAVVAPASTPAIADAVGNGTVNDAALSWLAPLGSSAADPLTFDPSAAPTVEICVVVAGNCAATPFVSFAVTPSTGVLPITVDATKGQYLASWNLLDSRLTTRRTYRISVRRGDAMLAAVHVDVVRGRWALTRANGTLAPLAAASSLPIAFHIAKPPARLFRDLFSVQTIPANGDLVAAFGADGSAAGAFTPSEASRVHIVRTAFGFLTLTVDTQGRPLRAQLGGAVLEFFNYRGELVDVAVALGAPRPSRVIVGVTLPTSLLALFATPATPTELPRSFISTSSPLASTDVVAPETGGASAGPVATSVQLRHIGTLLSGVACALGANGDFATIAPDWRAVAAALCNTPLLAMLTQLTGSDQAALDLSTGALDLVDEAQTCQPIVDADTRAACLTRLAGAAENFNASYQQAVTTLGPTLQELVDGSYAQLSFSAPAAVPTNVPSAVTFTAEGFSARPITAMTIAPLSSAPAISGCSTTGLGTTNAKITCTMATFTATTEGQLAYRATLVTSSGATAVQDRQVTSRRPTVTATISGPTELIAGLPTAVTFVGEVTAEAPISTVFLSFISSNAGTTPSQPSNCTTTGLGTLRATITCTMPSYTLPQPGTYNYRVDASSAGSGNASSSFLTVTATRPVVTATIAGPTTLIAGLATPVTLSGEVTSEAPISNVFLSFISSNAGTTPSQPSNCTTTGLGTLRATITCTMPSYTLPLPGTYNYRVDASSAGGGNASSSFLAVTATRPVVTATIAGPTTLIAGLATPVTLSGEVTSEAPISNVFLSFISSNAGTTPSQPSNCTTTGLGTLRATITCTMPSYTLPLPGTYNYRVDASSAGGGNASSSFLAVTATRPVVTASIAGPTTLIAGLPTPVTLSGEVTSQAPISSVFLSFISSNAGTTPSQPSNCTTTGLGTLRATITCTMPSYTLPLPGTYNYRVDASSAGGGNASSSFLTVTATRPVVTASIAGPTTLIAGLPTPVTLSGEVTSQAPISSVFLSFISSNAGTTPSQPSNCTTTGLGTLRATITCTMPSYTLPQPGTYNYRVDASSAGSGNASSSFLTVTATRPVVTASITGPTQLVSGLRSYSMSGTITAEAPITGASVNGSPALSNCTVDGIGTLAATVTCTGNHFLSPGDYSYTVSGSSAGGGSGSSSVLVLKVIPAQP